MSVLTVVEWEALEDAETVLYAGAAGMLAYTDVVPREDGHLAATLWSHCAEYVDGPGDPSVSEWPSDEAVLVERGARVAHALAVLAFGAGALPVVATGGVDGIGRGDIA